MMSCFVEASTFPSASFLLITSEPTDRTSWQDRDALRADYLSVLLWIKFCCQS